MTSEDRYALIAQLIAHEGRRADVYDDATGKRITKGSVVLGHPSWGIGFNLDATPFCDAAISAQFASIFDPMLTEVTAALPWTAALPPGPLRAILDIRYNAGLGGLLGFVQMLAYAKAGNYTKAAMEILDSTIAPVRAHALAHLMASAITPGFF
jgi:lysozyme